MALLLVTWGHVWRLQRLLGYHGSLHCCCMQDQWVRLLRNSGALGHRPRLLLRQLPLALPRQALLPKLQRQPVVLLGGCRHPSPRGGAPADLHGMARMHARPDLADCLEWALPAVRLRPAFWCPWRCF